MNKYNLHRYYKRQLITVTKVQTLVTILLLLLAYFAGYNEYNEYNEYNIIAIAIGCTIAIVAKFVFITFLVITASTASTDDSDNNNNNNSDSDNNITIFANKIYFAEFVKLLIVLLLFAVVFSLNLVANNYFQAVLSFSIVYFTGVITIIISKNNGR